jgi:hypothetical protein
MIDSAKNILEKHTIVVLNKALKQGFTQLPRYILKDKTLTFGARLTYAVLLSYAWQEDSCFPGQARMADDLGSTDRSIRRFLLELKGAGYIDWNQQGLGKTNVYFILDYQPFKIEADRTPASGLDRTLLSGLKRKKVSDK